MKYSREEMKQLLAEKIMRWTDEKRIKEWNPFANIDDAFQIVENMQKQGFTFSIQKIGEFYDIRRWRVLFTYQDGEVYSGDGQVVSIAICHAAIQRIDTVS